MPRTIVTVTALAAATLAPAVALAQAGPDYRCFPSAPGSTELTCVERTATPTAREEPPRRPEPEVRDMSARTHNFFVPTGNTLRDGDVELRSHAFGLWNTAAFGVSDNVELNVGIPVIPMFASFGTRIGLTDRESPLKASVGAGVWLPLISDDAEGFLLSGNATIGYQADEVNVHASASGVRHSEDDGTLALYNVGIAYQFHPKASVLGEALRLQVPGFESCDVSDGGGDVDGSCNRDYVDAYLVGVKLMGKHYDTDLGLLFPRADSEVRGFPMLSVTRRY